jgi:hypothetical protein
MKTCKCCGQEIKEGEWLDIPELGISVEINVHDKDKSWNDLGLNSKEDQLLTAEQVLFIMQNEKYAKILKMDGSSSSDDFWIKQYSPVSKRTGYVARFFAGSNCSRIDSYCFASDSYSGCGVRFSRVLKVKKKR